MPSPTATTLLITPPVRGPRRRAVKLMHAACHPVAKLRRSSSIRPAMPPLRSASRTIGVSRIPQPRWMGSYLCGRQITCGHSANNGIVQQSGRVPSYLPIPCPMRPKKPPIKKRPCPPSADRFEREVVAIGFPPSIGWKMAAIDAVARNGCAGVVRMRRISKVF